jgi:glycerophosphoryl diester phosphodiesterase
VPDPHPFLDWPGPIPFAHRGGTSAHPENTLPAFRHAVDLGFRYLETDVHVSADGVLVAFHDEDLSRSCGVDARIADLPWSEIEALRVDGREPIPRMRDLFEAFPSVRFNIDAKSDAAVDPLGDLVEELEALDRVCLAAFSRRRLQRFRSRFGRRVLTNTSQMETILVALFGWMPGDTPVAAQVPPKQGWLPVVNSRFVRLAHRGERAVHVWTIDEPEEMHRLLDLGVDGIMTDQPEKLRAVFEERGVWFE